MERNAAVLAKCARSRRTRPSALLACRTARGVRGGDATIITNAKVPHQHAQCKARASRVVDGRRGVP